MADKALWTEWNVLPSLLPSSGKVRKILSFKSCSPPSPVTNFTKAASTSQDESMDNMSCCLPARTSFNMSPERSSPLRSRTLSFAALRALAMSRTKEASTKPMRGTHFNPKSCSNTSQGSDEVPTERVFNKDAMRMSSSCVKELTWMGSLKLR